MDDHSTVEREAYQPGGGTYWTAGLVDAARPIFEGRGTLEEVLRVYEGVGGEVGDEGEDGEWEMHIEMGDMFLHPRTWGIFLRNIAYTIAPALAEANDMTVEEAEAQIRAGLRWRSRRGRPHTGGVDVQAT
jgi:hypothetical protein